MEVVHVQSLEDGQQGHSSSLLLLALSCLGFFRSTCNLRQLYRSRKRFNNKENIPLTKDGNGRVCKDFLNAFSRVKCDEGKVARRWADPYVRHLWEIKQIIWPGGTPNLTWGMFFWVKQRLWGIHFSQCIISFNRPDTHLAVFFKQFTKVVYATVFGKIAHMENLPYVEISGKVVLV